jgi:hypothetical protein
VYFIIFNDVFTFKYEKNWLTWHVIRQSLCSSSVTTGVLKQYLYCSLELAESVTQGFKGSYRQVLHWEHWSENSADWLSFKLAMTLYDTRLIKKMFFEKKQYFSLCSPFYNKLFLCAKQICECAKNKNKDDQANGDLCFLKLG